MSVYADLLRAPRVDVALGLGGGRCVVRRDPRAPRLDGPAWDGFLAAARAAGALYHRDGDAWSAPLAGAAALARALALVPGVRVLATPGLRAALADAAARARAGAATVDGGLAAVAAALAARGTPLRPYQAEGARWIASRWAQGATPLLGDEQGLGKTVQALAALPAGAPLVVVAPAVARETWRRHLAWRPDVGREGDAWPEVGAWRFVSYGEALDLAGVALTPGTIVVLDEVDYCKNPRAQRTRRMSTLLQAVRACNGRALAMTGTPLKNRPPDLLTVLDLLGLSAETPWRSTPRFRADWGYRPGLGWEGARPRDGTADVLRRVMLRRNFLDVVRDVPDRTWEDVATDLDATARVACDRAAAALAAAGIDLATVTLEALTHARVRPAFGELSRARAALATAKIPTLVALVDEHERCYPDGPPWTDPMLVFSAHLAPLEALAARDGWAALTGETPTGERARLERAYQAGELRGLAVAIGAGRTAMTLTRGREVVFVDRDWTPSVNAQAAARAFRLGQTRGVRYRFLVARHAVDRRLADLLADKEAVTAATVSAAAVQEGALALDPGAVYELPAWLLDTGTTNPPTPNRRNRPMAKSDEDDETTDDGVYVGCKIDKATHDAFMRACFEVYGPREGRAAPVIRLLIRSWTQNPKKIKEVTT